MKKLSPRNLQKMIDEKNITKRKHPTLNLFVYNYTPHAQFHKIWNKETLSCRGLIMDDKDNIVARPFTKFFNLEEFGNQGKGLPMENFEVYEKLDGSLGILYWDGDKPCITTRGGFSSEPAIEGTKIIREKMAKDPSIVFDKDYTYLFEIIYPSNRIVVDYGKLRDLVLLAVINTITGTEKSYSDITARYGGRLSIVKRYDGINDYRILGQERKGNAEGYVIKFKDNTRIKIKFKEYKRLHKLMTGVNARRIWESLKANETIDQMCDRVPDEFYDWVQKAAQRVKQDYLIIQNEMLAGLADVEAQGFTGDYKEVRKQKALWIKENIPDKLRGLVFMALDGQDYREEIWDMIKPAHEKPFNMELLEGDL